MAGIDRVGFSRTAPVRNSTAAPASGGFVLPDDNVRAGNVAAPAPLASSFLFHDNPAWDETPAREQASALLSELAALQRSVLGGGDPAAVLRRLDGMLAAAPGTAAPPMLALLSAVRLRARVELARRAAT